ncbi:MAG TPA: VOC family protein [Candidatus Limnocylindrales bacterium]|jgi:catechol 2,3-dioxygenase-like lactoylglutathione lyase family enzyme
MLGDAKVVTTIPVVDLDRARGFYGDVLGLRFLWDSPVSIRFGAGQASEVSIFRRGATKADHTVAHFEVADIESTVRELAVRGVVFIDYAEGPLQTTDHIARLGAARGAWFHDTEGNVLGLRQE